jgi:hypothetical protein
MEVDERSKNNFDGMETIDPAGGWLAKYNYNQIL